jgi:hypothetical protein
LALRNVVWAVAAAALVASAAATLAATALPAGNNVLERSTLPLFDVFKTICFDTGASPETVAAAIEAAGGAPKGTPGSTAWPFPMTTRSWDIVVGGHKMMISAGGVTGRFTACTVNSWAGDDRGVAAIKQWVGVQPNDVHRNTDYTRWSFAFRDRDGTREPIADRWEREHWELELEDGQRPMAYLTHWSGGAGAK